MPLIQKPDGDIEGVSPNELRSLELSRIRYIEALESQNKQLLAERVTLQAEISSLKSRLAEHDKALAEVRAMGETPWVTAAKKGAPIV